MIRARCFYKGWSAQGMTETAKSYRMDVLKQAYLSDAFRKLDKDWETGKLSNQDVDQVKK